MFGNLLRPWLLARLVTSGTGAVLAIAVLVLSAQLLRAPVLARSSEGQLHLDRRAELISSLTRVAAWASIASLVVAVLGADRLHGAMRGAMCAYGVLDATDYGFRSLMVAMTAALGASAWLSLHRAELLLPRPTLTQLKLFTAAALAPLFVGDLLLSTLHAVSLDFREVASCCSSGLEAGRAVFGASGGPRMAAVFAFFGSGLAAAVFAAWLSRAPSRFLVRATTLASTLALLAAPLAILSWVAPYAYGTPNHLCPFCLLHADEAMGIGWPLYAALAFAGSRGIAVGVTGYVLGDARRARLPAGERAEEAILGPELARLARGAAVAWGVALVLALSPWAFFTLQSGGVSLFG